MGELAVNSPTAVAIKSWPKPRETSRQSRMRSRHGDSEQVRMTRPAAVMLKRLSTESRRIATATAAAMPCNQPSARSGQERTPAGLPPIAQGEVQTTTRKGFHHGRALKLPTCRNQRIARAG